MNEAEEDAQVWENYRKTEEPIEAKSIEIEESIVLATVEVQDPPPSSPWTKLRESMKTKWNSLFTKK